MTRRQIIAVIGGNIQIAAKENCLLAEEVGRELVEHGYRILSGGLGGIMEAASRGAHTSQNYREGDVIGIIPGLDRSDASSYCDIIIATGMQFARNQIIVASADAIVAIGGGAGTLSEIAFAWQLGKPIYAFQSEGWSGKLGGSVIDSRPRKPIRSVKNAAELINCLHSDLQQ
ncbi:MAG: TIGR00725 family protein [Candidatus Thorarchaeota archaeon]